MQKIINSALDRLDKHSTLDEIKSVLKQECRNVTFPIYEKDWQYMITEILYSLHLA